MTWACKGGIIMRRAVNPQLSDNKLYLWGWISFLAFTLLFMGGYFAGNCYKHKETCSVLKMAMEQHMSVEEIKVLTSALPEER